MKKYLLIILLFSVSVLSAGNKNKPSVPLGFIENRGQILDQNHLPNPSVKFLFNTPGLNIQLKANCFSYDAYAVKTSPKSLTEIERLKAHFPSKIKVPTHNTTYNFQRVDVVFLGANTNCYMHAEGVGSDMMNYYTEGGEITGVNHYNKVTYKNLYNGIDLEFLAESKSGGTVKYNFIIHPGADYKQIKWKYMGANNTCIDADNIQIKLQHGMLTETIPMSFILTQNNSGSQSKEQVKVTYNSVNNIYSFNFSQTIGNSQTLIIDPTPNRTWGTYYGGNGDENGGGCATDASGNVYLADYTDCSVGNIIATAGSHMASFGGGIYNAYLAKFNSSGVRQWGTYYGGSSWDMGLSCATDALGNVYMAGYTDANSGTVIATAGAHQTTNGGSDDAFLVKFNSAGVRQWGTYYGGGTGDFVYSCVTDANNNVYIAGYTGSFGGIASAGAHQTSNAGSNDAFVAKFNSAGVRQWGTFYGGVGLDYAYGCSVDLTGNVFLIGSTSVPTGTSMSTVGAHQSSYGGGASDAFLAKFNSAGVRQWGTLYGDTGDDEGRSCANDASGNVFIVGWSDATTGTVIATPGSHQPTYGGNLQDAYLVKFNGAGVRQWGTYYGGTGQDFALSCAVDANNNVVLAGNTSSSGGTVIATPNAYQTTFNAADDGFLAKFNNNGIRQWGTYYGSTGNDYIQAISIQSNGDVALTGNTDSPSGFSSPFAHQITNGGGFADAFVALFTQCPALGLTGSANVPCEGSALTLSASITNTLPTTYNWAGPASFTAMVQNPNIPISMLINGGMYTLTATSGTTGCSEVVIFSVTVKPVPVLTVTSTSSLLCIGQTATLNALGGNTYTWSTSSNNATISVSPTTTIIYTINTTATNGCTNTSTFTQSVSPCTGISEIALSSQTVSVFPNPSSGLVYIQTLIANEVEVYNCLGQKIDMPLKESSHNYILDLSNYPNGIYFINANNRSFKIIKVAD